MSDRTNSRYLRELDEFIRETKAELKAAKERREEIRRRYGI